MKTTHCILVIASILIFGCSQGHKYSESQSVEESSPVAASEFEAIQNENTAINELKDSKSEQFQGYTSSAAAFDNNRFGNRQFIRTSEMKFKVDNVINATYKIEDITLRNGGFVEKSEIKNAGEYTETIAFSADSAKLVTRYTLESYLRIRVPSQSLDSTLKAIAPLVGKMDYRIVEANDVSLSLHSDKLKQEREKAYSKRVEGAVDAGGRKLNDVVDAEKSRKDAQRSSDDAYLSTLSMSDKIEFSTVTIRMYQKEASKTEIIARAKEVEVYQTPFVEKMKDAFIFSCNILGNIVIFLTQVWVFIAIAIVAIFVYRKYKKNKS